MKITIERFAGEIPKVSDHLLPIQNASEVYNAKLTKGELQAWRSPLLAQALSGASVQTILQYAENGNLNWCEFTQDIDHINYPLTGEAYERVAFTGKSEPRVWANDLAGSPFDPEADYYKLGVPAPTTALTIAAGYTTDSQYRAYVYIFVNSYGEKGPNSPTVSISDYASGTVALQDFEAAPADREIDKIYLYRTSSSTDGVTTFRFVLEATWFDATASYVVGDFVIYATDLYKCTTNHSGAWNAGNFTVQGDDVADADLGTDTLESTTWDPPPATLAGLVILPTGIAAGFVGNDVYLSEPYQIHAWPEDYIVSIPQTIIGLGIDGNNIIVATNGNPYVISGLTPSQMSPRKLKGYFPCLSKRSIVSSHMGVQFACKEGMVRSNASVAIIDTAGLIDPLDWELFYPDTIVGQVYGEKYYGFYEDDDGVAHGFLIDYLERHTVRLDFEGYAFYISEDDGKLYLALNDDFNESDPPVNPSLSIFQWEGDQYNYLYYRFKTKQFLLPYLNNFSCARILFDEEFYSDLVDLIADDDYLATQNTAIFAGDILGAVNDDPVNVLPVHGDLLYDIQSISSNPSVILRIYKAGTLKQTKSISNNQIFKLNSGYKGKKYHFEIEGNIPIKRMDVANSVKEIMRLQ